MLKKIFQNVSVLTILTASFFSTTEAVVECQTIDLPQVLEKVAQLEQKGILKQTRNGYLYLEVSQDFIKEILPLIDAPGKIVPHSRHFRGKRDLGAHIGVMHPNEQILNEIWEIKELGQEFTFTVTELKTVKINRHHRARKLWVLVVSSPELEQLRESYGLQTKLHGRNFHITLGAQIPGKPDVMTNEDETIE